MGINMTDPGPSGHIYEMRSTPPSEIARRQSTVPRRFLAATRSRTGKGIVAGGGGMKHCASQLSSNHGRRRMGRMFKKTPVASS